MNHSPADMVARILIALGYGTTPVAGSNSAWPIFATREPATPDDCITVFNTTGVSDGRSMIDGELQEHLGIQVRVRSADVNSGWSKCKAIQTALAKQFTQRTVSIDADTYTVHCLATIGQVIHIGNDLVSRREVHTVNALVSVSVIV